MKEYRLIDDRTKKPLTDRDGDALVYVFDGEPHNGDEITIDNKPYRIQRAWVDGELVVALQRQGVVLC